MTTDEEREARDLWNSLESYLIIKQLVPKGLPVQHWYSADTRMETGGDSCLRTRNGLQLSSVLYLNFPLSAMHLPHTPAPLPGTWNSTSLHFPWRQTPNRFIKCMKHITIWKVYFLSSSHPDCKLLKDEVLSVLFMMVYTALNTMSNTADVWRLLYTWINKWTDALLL